ncbi:DNA-protecting protein DprA [Microbulbifer sp. OS29]|uniref:DNA-protecting protein DprA n=1 Tax=Microbulbifer okhotskensis TaxID=2926617 RepID=A0A9X2J5H3_9GAMM|nr:DNA-processing protein DprA [Microbulbifer okhotskensis]MCO1335203.1 DNA-protecting protein DprA [Microbulbifer okhotskensis]
MDIVEIQRGDQRYPLGLEDAPSPPAVLYARGNIDLLSKPGIAIVGSRDASTSGLEIARRIAAYAVSKGNAVVSGLALGIDAAAHEGALAAGGGTIAVLAHGLHTANPRANYKLALRILETGGLWVSEHPEGVTPQRHFFVARNRIQVGLSQSSVIVESATSSGTMKHADFCLQARHRLFAVAPHNPENSLGLNCQGPLKLINDGKATALRTKADYDLLEL